MAAARGATGRLLALLALPLLLAALTALLAWAARPRPWTEPFDDQEKPTIFVSVASYRDADCLATLRSMFGNASDASRVFAGVCEQNTNDAGEVCLPAGFEWHDQVRRISLPHREAKGPTYARYLCSTLYRGETYFCQIDSHTRFAKGWDAKAIKTLKACPSAKPVLTHYPHDWEHMKAENKVTSVPVLCKSKFDAHGVPTFEAVSMEPSAGGAPRPVPFTSGGFVFGPGEMLREVPYDPDLPQLFQGEEILYSARLWTTGYDFFTPTQNLVYHHYYRETAPKFWSDVDYSAQQAATLAKVKKLLQGRMDAYPHGMGTARQLGDYWDYAGLDWTAKTSTSESKFCK